MSFERLNLVADMLSDRYMSSFEVVVGLVELFLGTSQSQTVGRPNTTSFTFDQPLIIFINTDSNFLIASLKYRVSFENLSRIW